MGKAELWMRSPEKSTEQDKQAILIAIAQLEDRNPTPRPVEALCDLLDGSGDRSTLRARVC